MSCFWVAANVPKRRRIVVFEGDGDGSGGGGGSNGDDGDDNNFVGTATTGADRTMIGESSYSILRDGSGGFVGRGGASSAGHSSVNVVVGRRVHDSTATRGPSSSSSSAGRPPGTVSSITTNNKDAVAVAAVRKKMSSSSGETVEAALSRLSKAYSTAMECIGAAQRTDRLYKMKKNKDKDKKKNNNLNDKMMEENKTAFVSTTISPFAFASQSESASTSENNSNDDNDDDNNNKLDVVDRSSSSSSSSSNSVVEAVQRRVVMAARTTLEESILMDPLVVPYIPTLQTTMMNEEQQLEEDNEALTAAAAAAAAVAAATGDGDTPATTATTSSNNRWTTLLNRKRHVIPPTITSSAHRAKIRELAYLSLVNYSDLLQTCGGDDDSTGGESDIINAAAASSASSVDGDYNIDEEDNHSKKKNTILDRGIIRRLSSIPKEGCWGIVPEGGHQPSSQPQPPLSSLDEAYITTQRLAVSALCDASALDGSDPVLWLKLACATRRLENSISSFHDQKKKKFLSTSSLTATMSVSRGPTMMTTTQQSKYRRLQRYALEQGMMALPSHMPPNKTIVRALEELDHEPEPAVYVSSDDGISMNHHETNTKTLVLTRYSWLTLGRMILHSCRGDDNLLSSPAQKRRNVVGHLQQQHRDLFGSPTIVIRMSPMISLPPKVIDKICLYLDDASIRVFAATCRSLSAVIVASRDATAKQLSGQQQGQHSPLTENPKEDHSKSNPTTLDSAKVGTNENEEKVEEPVTTEVDAPVKRPKRKLRVEGQRSSKRVRSNEEKSGRKQEREKNRNSFEYCFTATTSGCSVQDHHSSLKQLMDGPTYSQFFNGTHLWNANTHRPSSPKKNVVMGGNWTSSDIEACERISDSSLSKFIIQWSSRNSGPIDMVEKFVRHIALHVEDIFGTTESNSKEGLVSCLLQCIDMLATRSGFRHSMSDQFFSPVEKTGSISRSIELFAIDVLHVELILRQIDRTIPAVVDFDDNENTISIMIPRIVDAALALESTVLTATSPSCVDVPSDTQSFLKSVIVRCYWVVAGYYFWRSKSDTPLYVSKEAEEEGLCFLEKGISCFESPVFSSLKVVSTPHLATQTREDPCWDELSFSSLVKFRNEVQASSVISDARQKFEELLVESKRFLEEEPLSEDLPDDMVTAFASIGSRLYERYDSGYGDNKSKLSELIEDVISVHGNDLMYGDADENNRLQKVSKILSLNDSNFSRFENSDYSILSMLVSCLSADSSNSMMLANLMIRLILTTTDMYKSNLDDTSAWRFRDPTSTDDNLINTDVETATKHDKDFSLRHNGTYNRGRKYMSFVRELVDSLLLLLDSRLSSPQQEELISSDEFILAIHACCEMANLWFNPHKYHASFDDIVDRQVFVSTSALMDFVAPRSDRRMAEIAYFYGMIRIIVRHHDILESLLNRQVERSERSSLQRVCIERARFLDPVLSNLGNLLSRYLSEVKSMTLKRGALFDGPSTSEVFSFFGQNGVTDDELTVFLHSVQRLWKYSSQIEVENSDRKDTTNVTSSFDRPIVKILRIPVTILIVGLCGSACQSRNFPPKSSSEAEREDPLSLSEMFDSDASCNGWESDCNTGEETSREESRLKELLRVICHGVNCVRLVLEPISDKDAVTLALETTTNSTIGPRLPLIASRVLNFYADILLMSFHVHEPHKLAGKITYDPLWSEFYPFRTQDIGELLDGVLHKCYRWLHGFALIGEAAHVQSSGKDLASTASDIPEILNKKFAIENTTAAAQLYRCVLRAYAGGRRTPPKSALEVIKSALPPMEESEQSTTIRRFIFDGTLPYFSLDDIQKIVRKNGDWENNFSSLHDFICPNERLMLPEASFEENEVMKIRRGLSKQLSSGPIPVDPTDLSSDDARVVMQQHEEEISKKFNYIIDDLCISDASDIEGWYQASQCLTVKADVIADRLGYNNGFTRVSNFSVPTHRSSKIRGIPIEDLETYQAAETKVHGWIEYLGNDLSLYVNHKWSSFESLLACKKSLEGKCSSIDDQHSSTYHILRDIDRKFDEKNFVLWQEAWGGMFVAALRNMSIRCLGVALYILQKKESRSFPETIRAAEMCEAFGVAVYGNLMANQKYGYPMHSITRKEKRDIAVTAQICFDASIDLVDTSTTQDDASDDRTTWDLDLMVGKCHEKIASTYRGEEYSTDSTPDLRRPRRYAIHMTSAIDSYKKALMQAKRIENDGVQIVDQAGGSAHGSTEVLYRLHTARLKIHIEAVSRHECEVRAAEEEALKMTEKEWFIQPEEIPANQSLRDRVWVVFADIVAGLAECRRVQPFFHRSVFRHAQALMWSPILHDPISSRGSTDTVPATRSVHIRGLNNSTSAAESAEAVIKTLFDKKRSQLAAVWITTTAASSPLQILNSTIRKYDSVRGKYIAAYIETLHLCDRRGDIETFMRWLYAAKMDLPAYFQASAKAGGGGKPAKSQAHDSLLIIGGDESLIESQSLILSSKRKANSNLADVLIHEMRDAITHSPPSEYKRVAESYLKHSYASYLRLNCTPRDLKRVRAWRYGADTVREVEALCLAWSNMEQKDDTNTTDFGEWSGGSRKSAIFDAALSHCRQMYPTLSTTFFSKKTTTKSEKRDKGE